MIFFQLWNYLNICPHCDIVELFQEELKSIEIPKYLCDSFFKRKHIDEDTLIEKIASKFKKDVEVGHEKKYLHTLVETKLFPHFGITPRPQEIMKFLCLMLRKLILTITKKRMTDDIDSMYNKRIETTGVLCHELLAMMFKKFFYAVTLSQVLKTRGKQILKRYLQLKTISTTCYTCLLRQVIGVFPKAAI